MRSFPCLKLCGPALSPPARPAVPPRSSTASSSEIVFAQAGTCLGLQNQAACQSTFPRAPLRAQIAINLRMPPLYLGRYTRGSRSRTEDFSPKMARFTGKSPSTDKASAFGPRVTIYDGDVFPDETTVGVAPFRDLDGRPLYVGTAILDDSAVPCQISPESLANSKRPSTRRTREAHPTRYDVLVISSSMQWVPTEHGKLPPQRCPVHGGHEHSSPHLYHAIARIGNTFIPGKTSPALGGAYVTYDGEEYFFDSDYYVLCWR
ncbi:hypothetical protein FS749_007025 [Ceratobasidium sp. UAMH 11750]|nr:hypothetical protein FS749_007025 [Ceratobasidium sp. UAMH 11750]